MEEDQVREHSGKLDICKSIADDGINSEVLRSWLVSVGLLLILFE